jgi:hypothetical protein
MILGKKLELFGIQDKNDKLIATVEKSLELHEVLGHLLSEFGFSNLYQINTVEETTNVATFVDYAESYKNEKIDITLFFGHMKVLIVASSQDQDIISKFKKAILYYFEFKNHGK